MGCESASLLEFDGLIEDALCSFPLSGFEDSD
jgi:hypothetical protein